MTGLLTEIIVRYDMGVNTLQLFAITVIAYETYHIRKDLKDAKKEIDDETTRIENQLNQRFKELKKDVREARKQQ